MNEAAQNKFDDRINIKVVGVGDAGDNAVNRMIAEGLQNVESVTVNTDAKDLLRSDADIKISLSDKSSRGLDAGADPEYGAKAAQDHQLDIEEASKGADTVFTTCGEGGGTGTDASPIAARTTYQQGVLTITAVTHSFSFEGLQRFVSAEYGIDNLRKEVDALIVISNDHLLELFDHSADTIEAFKTANTVLLAGIQGITDLISMNSYIHVNFNDVNSIFRGAGATSFGIGSARGGDRVTQATEIAINSLLLEESIEGVYDALIDITGPANLKLQETPAATELVCKTTHPEAQIIWGLTLDDAYGDEVRVTVAAVGFDPVAARNSSTQSTVTPIVPTAVDPTTPAAQPAPAPAPAAQSAATAQPVFAPTTGDSVSLLFDDPTSAHLSIAVNDPVDDLDIPDFLCRKDQSMAGSTKNAMSYLDTSDVVNDEDDYIGEDEEQKPASRSAFDSDHTVAPLALTTTPAVSSTIKSFPGGRMNRIIAIHLKSYEDAQLVGRALRDGVLVVLNLTDMTEAVVHRIADLSAGVVFGVRGPLGRVTPCMFLLSPTQANIKTGESTKSVSVHDLFADQPIQ